MSTHLPLNVRLGHNNSRTVSRTHIYCSWKMTWTGECKMSAPLIVLQRVCITCLLFSFTDNCMGCTISDMKRQREMSHKCIYQCLSLVLVLDIFEIFMKFLCKPDPGIESFLKLSDQPVIGCKADFGWYQLILERYVVGWK